MSNSPESIAVISTYATDHFINSKTREEYKEQKGGPVEFLVRALKKLGLKPSVFTGSETLSVDILVDLEKGDEFGRIRAKPTITPFPETQARSAIVSTILDEWDLSDSSDFKGLLFVDIQGYVRDGTDFGKKKAWDQVAKLAPYIFCLKGNEIEMSQIPLEVLENQKRERMVIITKDKKGADIFFQGKSFHLTPLRILNPPNTVGAGDTFFANFVYKFLETQDIEISCRFAFDQTSDFLAEIT